MFKIEFQVHFQYEECGVQLNLIPWFTPIGILVLGHLLLLFYHPQTDVTLLFVLQMNVPTYLQITQLIIADATM